MINQYRVQGRLVLNCKHLMPMLTITFVQIVGCSRPAQPHDAVNTYTQIQRKLATCCSLEQTVSDVEQNLQLGPPVDIRAPTFMDPMWWFSYVDGDTRLELAANPIDFNQPGVDILERSSFQFIGYWWTGPASGPRRRRYDAIGRLRFTHEVLAEGRPASGPYAEYLRALELREPIGIIHVEKALSLPPPKRVMVGSLRYSQISLMTS